MSVIMGIGPRAQQETGDTFVVSATPTIIKLAYLCKENAHCYVEREPYTQCFCLELFRRAVIERDDDAWAAVYDQYADRVRYWLGTPWTHDDEEVTVVFERFWQAVDGAKFTRFHSLAAVLQYLKMCAYSVRMDRGRALRATASEHPLDEAVHRAAGHDDVEETVTQSVDARRLWAVVRSLLCDEREGLVLYLSYVMGLTPREIRARHHGHFPDVAEVYRLKRNVLDRLRRAPEIKALAGVA